MRNEEQRVIQEARDKAVLELASLHRQIRQASLDLQRERSKKTINTARKSLANVRAQLGGEVLTLRAEKLKPKDSIAVGDTVYMNDIDLYGTVRSISKKTREAEVQAGQITLRVKLDSIEKAGSGAVIQPEAKSKIIVPGGRPILNSLDLRGKRADEVEVLLDGYLNEAALANLSQVQIIHGIGTGTVRQIVRDFLATHPLVRTFRTGTREEGGDGVTMAKL